MAKKSKQDWDVRTNLNPSPGTQGTLFSGGKQFMSDKRYPRGYTPERANKVWETLVDTDSGSGIQGSPMPRVWTGSPAGAEKTVRGKHVSHIKEAQGYRDILDTISRSTVPTGYLKGVDIHVRDRFTQHVSDLGLESELPHHINSSLAGMYNNADAVNRPRIQVKPEFTTDSTVIHEIGHRVSDIQDTPHNIRNLDEWKINNKGLFDQRNGQEEAFADDFAHEHFRDRRGRQPGQEEYYLGDRSNYFKQAYHHSRKTPYTRSVEGMVGRPREEPTDTPMFTYLDAARTSANKEGWFYHPGLLNR